MSSASTGGPGQVHALPGAVRGQAGPGKGRTGSLLPRNSRCSPALATPLRSPALLATARGGTRGPSRTQRLGDRRVPSRHAHLHLPAPGAPAVPRSIQRHAPNPAGRCPQGPAQRHHSPGGRPDGSACSDPAAPSLCWCCQPRRAPCTLQSGAVRQRTRDHSELNAPSRAGACHNPGMIAATKQGHPGTAGRRRAASPVPAHPAPRILRWSLRPRGAALPISDPSDPLHRPLLPSDSSAPTRCQPRQHHSGTMPSAGRELLARSLSTKGDTTHHGRATHAPLPPHDQMPPAHPVPTLPGSAAAARGEPCCRVPRRALPRPRLAEPRSSWTPQHP